MKRIHSIVPACLVVFSTPVAAQVSSAMEDPAVARVREMMSDRLLDPWSAQIVLLRSPWRGEQKVMGDTVDGDWYCAKINAKNAYGGYVGFRNYLLVDGPGQRDLAWEFGGSPLMAIDRTARKLCAPSPP